VEVDAGPTAEYRARPAGGLDFGPGFAAWTFGWFRDFDSRIGKSSPFSPYIRLLEKLRLPSPAVKIYFSKGSRSAAIFSPNATQSTNKLKAKKLKAKKLVSKGGLA